MPKLLDIDELKNAVEKKADPFDFYLYLAVSNGGELDSSNPYCNNLDYLKTLLHHFEAIENFDMCVEYRKRIKELV